MQTLSIHAVMRRRLLSAMAAAIGGLGLMAPTPAVLGQSYSLPSVTVTTLGGGPIVECGHSAGFVDGNTFDFAQFNEPYATVLDQLGNLYVADTKNNAVRQVSAPGDTANSLTTTMRLDVVFTTVNGSGNLVHTTNNAAFGVVGVAEDSANDLYVMGASGGFLTKWNQYFNLLEGVAFTNTASSTALSAAAIAVSHDAATNIFIAFTNGVIVRLNLTNSTFPASFNAVGITPGGTKQAAAYPAVHYVVPAFNWKPAGITLMPNGELAVSDLLNDAIYLVSTNDNSTPVLYTGGNSNGYTSDFAGYIDGPPAFAQFNQPHGIAASSDGHIVVADTGNNVVRIIDTNVVTTTLYGTLKDQWLATDCSSIPAIYYGWLDGPTGDTFTSAECYEPASVTIASNGVVYVTELFYDLVRQAAATGLSPVFFTNALSLQLPSIAITNPISSSFFTTNSTIDIQVSASDPNSGGFISSVEYLVNGANLALVTNNPFTFAWNNPAVGTNIITAEAFDNFNLSVTSAPVTVYVIQPKSPSVSIISPANNTLVFNPTNVAVSVVATDPNPNGVVESISLYANETTLIGQQSVISNNTANFLWINPTPPGSNSLNAVALDNFGILTTSAPVNIIVSGLPPSAAPPPPPSISPSSGYFPFCQTIQVSVTATNQPIQLFYTTDGSTPTTNSLPVTDLSSNNQVFTGSIQWCNPLSDLTSLKIIAFNGVAISTISQGSSSPTNIVGFVRGAADGPGSTVVLPVVVDLESNGVLESVQFRVEVTPIGGNPNPLTYMQVLPATTNDFIQLVIPGTGNVPVTLDTVSYTTNNGLGLIVSASGGGSGFSVHNFAAVCLLAVQIPTNCVVGQQYQLSVLVPSGTSDARQTPVNMVTMTNQILTVATVQYMAGDSSPGSGYNAGEFGDGALTSADVNNVRYASVGIRVPFPFSDAYNAMDVYPETSTEIGDNFITYLDWQHVLLRSEGLETNNWMRFWAGGVRQHYPTNWSPTGPPVTIGITAELLPSKAPEDKPESSRHDASNSLPGYVWFRPAAVGAGTITNLIPGNSYSIPVYEKSASGYSAIGFEFRALLTGDGGAPQPGALQFVSAAGLPAAQEDSGLSPNDIICSWNLNAFNLQGSNFLGSITFQVPSDAQIGQSYSLHFLLADGADGSGNDLPMETFPGKAWVGTSAQQPPQITSDEWRTNFFGSYSNPIASDFADPDGDGSLNWQEFIAGTNPADPLSRLQFSSISGGASVPSQVSLNWLTAPGKTYLLELSPTPGGTNWSVVNMNSGDGNVYRYSVTNLGGAGNYYRISVQP